MFRASNFNIRMHTSVFSIFKPTSPSNVSSALKFLLGNSTVYSSLFIRTLTTSSTRQMIARGLLKFSMNGTNNSYFNFISLIISPGIVIEISMNFPSFFYKLLRSTFLLHIILLFQNVSRISQDVEYIFYHIQR